MTQFTTTDLGGTINIEVNGAFVLVRWNGFTNIRAYNPRLLMAGIDDKVLWLFSSMAREGAPATQPFSTEFQCTFATNAAAVTAGTALMGFCATALLAGGGP